MLFWMKLRVKGGENTKAVPLFQKKWYRGTFVFISQYEGENRIL